MFPTASVKVNAKIFSLYTKLSQDRVYNANNAATATTAAAAFAATAIIAPVKSKTINQEGLCLSFQTSYKHVRVLLLSRDLHLHNYEIFFVV